MFVSRASSRKITSKSGPKLDNLGLMTASFELAEACHAG